MKPGFETITLRSKLNLHHVEVLPLWMTPICNYFVELSLNGHFTVVAKYRNEV